MRGRSRAIKQEGGKESGERSRKEWRQIIVLSVVFVLFIIYYDAFRGFMGLFFPIREIYVDRTPLYRLAMQHLYIVLISSSISLTIALFLGVTSTLQESRDMKDLVLKLSAFGETFPSIAIIALTVPILGYGTKPTVMALSIYGILPILRNTVTGIENVPPDAVDAAFGMGMNKLQVLYKVQIPLALPVIMAGIRTSVITNIAATTVGATVGAGGFGIPIVTGIRSYDPILILQGSIPVTLMAIIADLTFKTLEDKFSYRF